MSIRFPTEAANADILADESPGETADQPAKATGTGAKRDPYLRTRETYQLRDAGKPGRDINAAGFIKDKDAPRNDR